MRKNVLRRLINLLTVLVFILAAIFTVSISVSAEDIIPLAEGTQDEEAVFETNSENSYDTDIVHKHVYFSYVIKAAKCKCTDETIIRYECKCGDYYDKVIPAEGHKYVLISDETVDHVNTKTYKCSVCDDTYSEVTETEEPHVHAYEDEIISEGSCTEDTVIRHTCSCGSSYEETIPAPGHKYELISEETVNYICTKIYKCSVCDDTYSEVTEEEPHVHTYEEEVISKGSCTEDTVTRYTCDCGYYYDEIIAAPGHKYELISEGYEGSVYTKNYKCSVCGKTYSETEEEDTVAKIYICAKSSISPLGHTWIYVENLTDHDLDVGLYKLPSGQGVSLGTFGVTRADGRGLYYNVESYCVNKYGLRRVIYMDEDLSIDELNKANKKILKSNHWNPITNCTGFSFSVWNTVSKHKLIPLFLPVLGRFEMLLHDHDTNPVMFYPAASKVFKQEKNNEKAYLTGVSPNTISHGV